MIDYPLDKATFDEEDPSAVRRAFRFVLFEFMRVLTNLTSQVVLDKAPGLTLLSGWFVAFVSIN